RSLRGARHPLRDGRTCTSAAEARFAERVIPSGFAAVRSAEHATRSEMVGPRSSAAEARFAERVIPTTVTGSRPCSKFRLRTVVDPLARPEVDVPLDHTAGRRSDAARGASTAGGAGAAGLSRGSRGGCAPAPRCAVVHDLAARIVRGSRLARGAGAGATGGGKDENHEISLHGPPPSGDRLPGFSREWRVSAYY